MEKTQIWKNDWQIIKNASPDKRTHDAQCNWLHLNYDFDTFLDIGPGRTGSEAWSIKRLRPDCSIYGFEPQTQRFNLLKQNNYPGNIYNKAVAASAGEVEGFMGFDGGKSDFWLNADEKWIQAGAYKKTSVKCTTIDEIIENNHLDKVFIWADIEGAELEMLKGAKVSLQTNKIVGLNLELNKESNEKQHCSADEVIDFLHIYDFVPCGLYGVSNTHVDCFFRPKHENT